MSIQNRIGYPCSFEHARKIPILLLLIACFGPCFFSRLKIWQKLIKMQMFLWPEVEVEMIGLHSSSQLGSWYFIFCRKADHSQAISTSIPGPKMSTEESASPILQCGCCMTPVITLVSTCAVLEASLLKQQTGNTHWTRSRLILFILKQEFAGSRLLCKSGIGINA